MKSDGELNLLCGAKPTSFGYGQCMRCAFQRGYVTYIKIEVVFLCYNNFYYFEIGEIRVHYFQTKIT